jgi:hypothetical protein
MKFLASLAVAGMVFGGGMAHADTVTCYSTKDNGTMKPVELPVKSTWCAARIRSGVLSLKDTDPLVRIEIATGDLFCVITHE